jgi:ribosomal protein uS19
MLLLPLVQKCQLAALLLAAVYMSAACGLLYCTCFKLLLMVFIAAAGPLDKPAPVKTHLRNMVIVPEMIGSQVAVYNGKVFNLVLITAEMVGMYLGEFSITYRPVRHGRPGIGSTNSSRFIPLK